MKVFVSRLQIIVSLFLADIAGLLSCIYDPTLPQQALLISAKESAQEPLNIVFQDCIKKKAFGYKLVVNIFFRYIGG